MAIADQLLKLMFSWIEQRESCAENLRTLAQELEPSGRKRKTTNTDCFKSSDTMKEMQDIQEKSNRIQEEIQKLFERLKTESSSTDPNEVDRHIMAEVLKAMARRSEVKIPIPMKPEQLEGLGKQLIEQMSKTGLLKRRYKVVGGAVGLSFELSDAIDNWKDLIEGNRVTEAIQSLRETSDAILKTCRKLSEQFDNIRKIIKEVDKSRQEHQENKSSNPARDQSGNQQTSVESQTDQRHKDEQEGGTGSDQQRGGDQGDNETDSDEKHRYPNYERSEDYEPSEDYESSEDYEPSEDQYNINILNEKRKLHFDNTQTPPGTIKVGLLNVCSMKNKIPRILELITKNNLDVFLTTETWLQDNNAATVLKEASPLNYHYYYQNRVRPKKGGGVAIQFSPELQGENIPFDSITTFEYVVTVLHHDEWNQPVPFINVYYPPGYNKAKFKTFLNEFQNLLAHFKDCNSIVVTGDFNIWVDQKKRSYTDEFDHILPLFDLEQHVREPTQRSGHTLDLVITRNVEVSNLVVWDDKISDHYTVYFIARPVSRDKREETKKEKDQDEQAKQFKKGEE